LHMGHVLMVEIFNCQDKRHDKSRDAHTTCCIHL